MSVKILFVLGIILTLSAGFIFFSWTENGTEGVSNNSNTVRLDPNNNIYTTDVRTLGFAVVPSGKQVAYDTSFSKPDTTNFRQYCFDDGTCFLNAQKYLACPFLIAQQGAYVMEDASQCRGLQDAPAFVVEKIDNGDDVSNVSAFERLFSEKVDVRAQVTSDEIYGQKNGRTISCYDAKYDRVCKITLANGTSYSLDGRFYNEGETLPGRYETIHTTFDAIVRSMME